MEFNEKFSALLSLSSVKGVSLARAINIDTAQISRLKTGVRKMPHNAALIHDIANYLSDYFDSEYKISGLYELTGDAGLHGNFNQLQLADIIYSYLSTPDKSQPNREVHRFLNRFNDFIPDSPETTTIVPDAEFSPFAHTNLISYQTNEGKRQALLQFFSFLLSRGTACAIYIFSDEADTWLLEDEKFSKKIISGIKDLTDKGFKFIRVQPPSLNVESSFRDIERWLPAYMAGSLKMFFYPWARDELHRRTILVVPDVITLYSASLYGIKEAEMTFVATDSNLTNSFNAYFNDIVRRCRNVMTVYTSEENERILQQIVHISEITDHGIYKSHCLSAHTIPKAAHDTLRKRTNGNVCKMFDCYEKAESNKAWVLQHYQITDIMCLPNYKDILDGTEPVPGTLSSTDTLYYTKEEYVLHLQNIIYLLETYPNYNVSLLNASELDNVVIYTKGEHHVLLIKESTPFAMFEVTEQSFATSLVGYLKNMIKERQFSSTRQEVINHLQQEIQRIELHRAQEIS